mgnify:CR=1 FL=1
MSFLGGLFRTGVSGIPFIGEGAGAEFDRNFSAEQAHIARDFARVEAEKNRSFQERMRKTAHQDQVADMKAAGLNPILSAGGGGAGLPGGATAQASMAKSAPASGGASSAQMIRDMYNQTRKRAVTEIGKMHQETKTQAALENVHSQQKEVLSNTAKKIKADTDFIKNQNKIQSIKGDFYQKHGETLEMMNFIGTGANTAGSVTDTLFMLPKGVKAIEQLLKRKPPIGLK